MHPCVGLFQVMREGRQLHGLVLRNLFLEEILSADSLRSASDNSTSDSPAASTSRSKHSIRAGVSLLNRLMRDSAG